MTNTSTSTSNAIDAKLSRLDACPDTTPLGGADPRLSAIAQVNYTPDWSVDASGIGRLMAITIEGVHADRYSGRWLLSVSNWSRETDYIDMPHKDARGLRRLGNGISDASRPSQGGGMPTICTITDAEQYIVRLLAADAAALIRTSLGR